MDLEEGVMFKLEQTYISEKQSSNNPFTKVNTLRRQFTMKNKYDSQKKICEPYLTQRFIRNNQSKDCYISMRISCDNYRLHSCF